jgi:hypothetical protein
VGEANYVHGGQAIGYRIRFENIGPGSINPLTGDPFSEDKWATAPAQRVTIIDPLDENLDWSTFDIQEVGFGDMILTAPDDALHFADTISLTHEGTTFELHVTAGINLETGVVHATFQSIDPETHLPPVVGTGFLPPEDGEGAGMGYFAYTIRAEPDLPTGTEIRNVAQIVFDEQQVIATNQADPFDPTSASADLEALVTIDADSPTSRVEALASEFVGADVLVSWSGTDVGAGIAGYDIYVRVDDGPWELWLRDTTDQTAVWQGEIGGTYGFYSAARDGAGFRESAPTAGTVAQAETTVTSAPEHLRLVNVEVEPEAGFSIIRFTLVDGIPGETWTVQRAESLPGPWTEAANLIIGPDGSAEFEEALAGGDSAFYRVVLSN